MLRITGISLPLSYTEEDLRRCAADRLGVAPHKILSLTLRKRSVDARKKNDVHFNATVDVAVENESAVLRRCEKSGKVSRVTDIPYVIAALPSAPAVPPVVVGDAAKNTQDICAYIVKADEAGCDVVVAQCGVGKVNAAMCAQILCSVYGVTHIVNTGIAGSLCADLDIGDLVVSQDAMYHDVDSTAFGYPAGKIPGMDVIAFPADETLIQYALAAAEAMNPGLAELPAATSLSPARN